MSIYTKKGDAGDTQIIGGKVRKNDIKVETYGSLDEVNSVLGIARSLCSSNMLNCIINRVQKDIFKLSSELASDSSFRKKLKDKITEKDTFWLEQVIDYISRRIYLKKDFVTPGFTTLSALLDTARSVVRRAERRAVSLHERENLRVELLKYLNRLSDLLYILARYVDQEEVVNLVKQKVLKALAPKEVKSSGLSLEAAKQIVKGAENKADEMGVPMVISVVDQSGNLVAFHRMDGALLASIDISINKAFTAVSLKMPTHELADKAQPGKPLYGIQSTNNGRIVIFGGGFPLKIDGQIVGAIGVSGGSVEQDILVAQQGVKAFDELFAGS